MPLVSPTRSLRPRSPQPEGEIAATPNLRQWTRHSEGDGPVALAGRGHRDVVPAVRGGRGVAEDVGRRFLQPPHQGAPGRLVHMVDSRVDADIDVVPEVPQLAADPDGRTRRRPENPSRLRGVGLVDDDQQGAQFVLSGSGGVGDPGQGGAQPDRVVAPARSHHQHGDPAELIGDDVVRFPGHGSPLGAGDVMTFCVEQRCPSQQCAPDDLDVPPAQPQSHAEQRGVGERPRPFGSAPASRPQRPPARGRRPQPPSRPGADRGGH